MWPRLNRSGPAGKRLRWTSPYQQVRLADRPVSPAAFPGLLRSAVFVLVPGVVADTLVTGSPPASTPLSSARADWLHSRALGATSRLGKLLLPQRRTAKIHR